MKSKIISCILLAITSSAIAQRFETSKTTGNQIGAEHSLIYALPQTCIIMTVEVTKTSIKKGIYAEYAEKYLKLAHVPLKDSIGFAITNMKLHTQVEADPAQYYTITFKKFPEKLQQLFTLSNNGIILDFAKSWKHINGVQVSDELANQELSDPYLLENTSTEKVDTFYKTVLTDSTFVRIPVFKKQIHAKSEEEIVEETAHQLIKTRRHKIKILRGEYDFHPEGSALKVMVDELGKYEESLLALFAGTRLVEKKQYTFFWIPQPDLLSKEISYFNPAKGIQDQMAAGNSVISIQLIKEQDTAKGILPDKTKNTLFVRTPIMTEVYIKLDDKELSSFRIPVYQFGPVMVMPMN